jgi:hypothetical protein
VGTGRMEKGANAMNPYEQSEDMAQQRGDYNFCDICGYKQCQCEEIEAAVHAQERRDAQQKIDNFVNAARSWLKSKFWRAA